MSRDPLAPPAQAEPYVEAIGLDKAVEFLIAFGGTQVHLSRNPTGRSDVALTFGIEVARALGKAAEDKNWQARVPKCNAWCARILQSKGLSGQMIARRLRVTDVTVRKYLANEPGPIQLPLFEVPES